jgi:hypothetical protein
MGSGSIDVEDFAGLYGKGIGIFLPGFPAAE